MDSYSVGINVVVRPVPLVHSIEVIGDVDQVAVAALSRALGDAVAELPDLIEVDLSSATFFCCAAVAALQSAQQATDGRVVVIDPSRPVQRVLGAMGLASAFERAEITSA